MKGLLFAGFIFICFLLVACTNTQEITSCPEDTITCPDGSTLVRELPNCEFQDCPQLEKHANNLENTSTVEPDVPNSTNINTTNTGEETIKIAPCFTINNTNTTIPRASSVYKTRQFQFYENNNRYNLFLQNGLLHSSTSIRTPSQEIKGASEEEFFSGIYILSDTKNFHKLSEERGFRIINHTKKRLSKTHVLEEVFFEWRDLKRKECSLESTEQEPTIIVSCRNSDCIVEPDEEIDITISVSQLKKLESSKIQVQIDEGEELINANTGSNAYRYFRATLPPGSLDIGTHRITVNYLEGAKTYTHKQFMYVLEEDELKLELFESADLINEEGDRHLIEYFDNDGKDILLKHNAYIDKVRLSPNTCADLPNKDGSVAFTICYPHKTISLFKDNFIFKITGRQDKEVDNACSFDNLIEVGDDMKLYGRYYWELVKVYSNPKVVAYMDEDEEAVMYQSYGSQAEKYSYSPVRKKSGNSILLCSDN